MKQITPLLFFTFFISCVYAQTSDTLLSFSTDSNIIQDPRVNELVLKHILINEAKKNKIKGYRVQIHFGVEKAKAIETKTKFSSSYSKTTSYLDYQQPYFKVRVGDFRTKLEAYKFLQEISGEFPGAFIVNDEIELPPLD